MTPNVAMIAYFRAIPDDLRQEIADWLRERGLEGTVSEALLHFYGARWQVDMLCSRAVVEEFVAKFEPDGHQEIGLIE